MTTGIELLLGGPVPSQTRTQTGTPTAEGLAFSELLEAYEVTAAALAALSLPAPLTPPVNGPAEGVVAEFVEVPGANALAARLEWPSQPLPPLAESVSDLAMLQPTEATDEGAPADIVRVATLAAPAAPAAPAALAVAPAPADVAEAAPALAQLAHASMGVEARAAASDERKEPRGSTESPRRAAPDAASRARVASAVMPDAQRTAAPERSETPSRWEIVSERADSRPTEIARPAALHDGTPPGVVAPGESTGARALPTASSPAEAVPARIAWLAARGGGSARVTLHPAELGEVEVSVRVRGDSVEVLILTEQPRARAALLHVSDRFGEALASRDLRIESLEIRMTESRGAGLGDPGSGSGSATGREGAFAQSDRDPSAGRDGGRRPTAPGLLPTVRPTPLQSHAAHAAHLDLHV